MLYVTTEKFLRVFGINSLTDLPATEIMLPPTEETPVIIDGDVTDDAGGVVSADE